MFLLDINVWIALAFPSHVHHGVARAWFDGITDNQTCFFCRLTQSGFLRLANNPRVLPQSAVTQDQAWTLYRLICADHRVSFAPEPINLESSWQNYSQLQRFSPNQWNDAYLAAFAVCGGYEVVTFDQGFVQFPGCRSLILG